MAFTYGNTIGSNTELTSDNSIAVTLAGTASRGNLICVTVASDNTTGTDGESTTVSVTDSVGGNTWTRIREVQQSASGGAGSGIIGALFYSIITNTISSGETITVTWGSNVTAKAVGIEKFSADGAIVFIGSDFNLGSGTSATATFDPSGTCDLWIGTGARETKVTTGSMDADYNAVSTGDIATNSGTDASNARNRSGYRIATLGSDSYTDSSGATSTDGVVILAGFMERQIRIAPTIQAVKRAGFF